MSASMQRSGRRRTALVLGAVAAAMFGLGFAVAPLYDLWCELLGVDTSAVAAAGRPVTVRFDTNVTAELPWEFEPLVRRLEVRTGEYAEARFIARNRTGRAITARAIANVVPWQASAYFQKTECFCFRDQPLAAGESREMIVRFAVSPALPESIDSLILSYTFMNGSREGRT